MIDFLNIKNILIALVAGFIAGSISVGIYVYKYEENKWNSAIASQKIEAGRVLQAETERVLKAERHNTELNTLIEVEHATAQERINKTLADNRVLARKLGGLRDPGRRPNGGCTEAGNQATGTIVDASSRGQLSDEATEFLLTLTADADKTAEYAISCYKWVNGITEKESK